MFTVTCWIGSHIRSAPLLAGKCHQDPHGDMFETNIEGSAVHVRAARPQSFRWTETARHLFADTLAELDEHRALRVIVLHIPLTPDGESWEMSLDESPWTAIERQALSGDTSAGLLASRISTPLLAAISGGARGVDLAVAMACDLRIAVSTARFCFPHALKGTFDADGTTQLLPRLVGRARSLELLLTSREIGVEEAFRIGLISRVASPATFDQEVAALASEISRGAPIAQRYLRYAVLSGTEQTLEDGLRLEADLYILLHGTHDRTEGLNAFREKRRPRFEGT